MNIEKATLRNKKYRHAVATVPNNMQLVLMCLKPGEDIPLEVHPSTTQFIRVESGTGEVIIKNTTIPISDGWATIIPPNTEHYIRNTSISQDLKLYTIYTPPEHEPSTIHTRQP